MLDAPTPVLGLIAAGKGEDPQAARPLFILFRRAPEKGCERPDAPGYSRFAGRLERSLRTVMSSIHASAGSGLMGYHSSGAPVLKVEVD